MLQNIMPPVGRVHPRNPETPGQDGWRDAETPKDKAAPQHVLAKRICQYLPELFTFVEYPSVASSNNAAERAIRPAVIARKISGGTRSAKGSQTKTRLMSVFATWSLQGKEPIAACAQMIIAAQNKTALAMQ